MDDLFAVHSLIAFASLTALEIVLGVDNVVFIAILSNRLPEHQQTKARKLGLLMGALGRIVLLFAITWVMKLEKSVLFTVSDLDFTVKDLILMIGGLFLLGKGTWEIHHTLEVPKPEENANDKSKVASFGGIIGQIIALDMVFSIDSVLTAIGMVEQDKYADGSWTPLIIMVTAVLVSIGTMIAFSGPLSRFIQRHPTIKMLALSFLLLIGLLLVAEALHFHVPRGYIYFGMGFSLCVELLNLKLISKKKLLTPGDK